MFLFHKFMFGKASLFFFLLFSKKSFVLIEKKGAENYKSRN